MLDFLGTVWVEISFSIVTTKILMNPKSFTKAKQVFPLIRAEKKCLQKFVV